MIPNAGHDGTAPAPVSVLPELVFDLCASGPAGAALGNTETPVNVLSDQVFNLGRTPQINSE
jgi:hypothetical protein